MDRNHWDGLADEQGLIPAFGPARTDEHGRIVMNDEEWEARRDAAPRAIGDITDETDTDAIWDDAFHEFRPSPGGLRRIAGCGRPGKDRDRSHNPGVQEKPAPVAP